MYVRDEFVTSPTVKSVHYSAISSRYDGLRYFLNLKIAIITKVFVTIVVFDMNELMTIKVNL